MNRKLLAFIASGALALPMAAQTADVSVSGHINRALLFGDDLITGPDNDLKHSDGSASGSRFRMTGSEELDGGMTAGVNLEYGVGARKDPANPNLRHSAVYLSGAFGKLTLGQTASASDGVAYSNFDNYAFLAGIEVGCDFGCISDKDDPAMHGLPTYQGGRTETVRYDTPSLGPATVGISTGNDDFWDAALRVAGDAGGSKYQLKAGYGNTDDVKKNFAMSGAFGLANGSHFNAAWGQTDPAMGAKTSYWHVGLGHNFGDSSVAATYTDHEDKGGTKSWGIGVGHGMGGAQFYAGYKNLSYEVETETDHGFFVVGSRVRFN